VSAAVRLEWHAAHPGRLRPTREEADNVRCAVAVRLTGYVKVTGATDGVTAAEGRSCWLSSDGDGDRAEHGAG